MYKSTSIWELIELIPSRFLQILTAKQRLVLIYLIMRIVVLLEQYSLLSTPGAGIAF